MPAWTRLGAGAAAAGAAAAVVARRRAASRSAAHAPPATRAVTVLAPRERVEEALRDARWDELRSLATVDLAPAPGDKGTEVRARLSAGDAAGPVEALTGGGPDIAVRTALRQLKQVVEVGFVTTVAGQPDARSGLQSKVQDVVGARLKAGGRP
jgi:hypothetical protein